MTDILLFLPAPIAPRVWRLDIRENDYPVVYLDKRIPNASIWAKTDATFTGAVLPAVIAQVFGDILEEDDEPDMPWMKDWIQWADILMPGQKPPYSQSTQDTRSWIESLIDTFCRRHRSSDRLIRTLVGEEGVQ
jgi:hypothetical protein